LRIASNARTRERSEMWRKEMKEEKENEEEMSGTSSNRLRLNQEKIRKAK